jgi:lipopolysaccharide export system permease protein
MKIYERHLAREIYAATAIVLMGFMALFAFFDLIYELESVGKGGYQLRHALGYVALTIPGRLYELLPIGVLIGSLYALTALARQSEITVLRAAGVATRDFLWSFARIGVAFIILTLVVGELIAPKAEQAAQRLKLKAQGALVAQEFRTGLWVKDDRSFVNVGEVFPDASLKRLRIFEFDNEYRLRSISQAASGRYLTEKQWLLTNVDRTTFRDDSAHAEHIPELYWQTALNPELLSVLMVSPNRMSLINLSNYVHHLRENQQKTDRYEIAIWKKLTYPLATLVMMALALPFAYMQDRMGIPSIRIFAGVMLGVGFHLLNGLSSNLGIINSWPAWLAAITPSVLFLCIAGGMLWRVERR